MKKFLFGSKVRKIVSFSIFGLVVIYIAGGFAASAMILGESFGRFENQDGYATETKFSDYSQSLVRDEFTVISGSNELQGYLYGGPCTADCAFVGAPGPFGLIVLAHGFGVSSDDYLPQIEYFVQHNFQVLTYEGTGVNESEGSGRGSFFQGVEDLRAALKYVSESDSLASMPLALFGHSQGGFAVSSVLNFDEAKDVDAVIEISGPNAAGSVIDYYAGAQLGPLYLLLKPFIVILDWADFGNSSPSAVEGINKSGVPVMLAQGDADQNVDPNQYAITHFADDITNTQAEILIMTDEWDNGHFSILNSKEAFFYNDAADASWEEYASQITDRQITRDDLKEWADEYGYDKSKAHAINSELFSKITFFAMKYLGVPMTYASGD